jgi:MFS family permease
MDTVTARRRGVAARSAAFWFVALAFAVTMCGTTMPTPLYVRYQHQWHFSTLTITVIFAAYAVGVLAALFLFGRVSDIIGRRPTLLAGLTLAGASSIVFLLADSVGVLIVGRVLSGLSAGIFTGTATATLVDLAEDSGKATLIGTIANMGGLGAGPLLAGLLSRYAPAPLQLPFQVHLGLVVLAGAAVWLIPEPVDVRSARELTIPRLSVPRSIRTVFLRAAVAGFAGFAVLGLFTSVAPLFLKNLLDIADPALAGLLVFGVFAASTFGQAVLVKPMGDKALAIGCSALVLGMLTLAEALATGSLWLLLTAAALAGTGQGVSFRAALALLNATSPPDRRAEVASSFFVVAYVAISAPVVGQGLAANAVGLRTAGIGFSLAVAALGAIAAASFIAVRHPANSAPTE